MVVRGAMAARLFAHGFLWIARSPLWAVAASESRWYAGTTLCRFRDGRKRLNRYSAPRCLISGRHVANARPAGRSQSIPGTPSSAGKQPGTCRGPKQRRHLPTSGAQLHHSILWICDVFSSRPIEHRYGHAFPWSGRLFEIAKETPEGTPRRRDHTNDAAPSAARRGPDQTIDEVISVFCPTCRLETLRARTCADKDGVGGFRRTRPTWPSHGREE
jgi:hypothetical protein